MNKFFIIAANGSGNGCFSAGKGLFTWGSEFYHKEIIRHPCRTGFIGRLKASKIAEPCWKEINPREPNRLFKHLALLTITPILAIFAHPLEKVKISNI